MLKEEGSIDDAIFENLLSRPNTALIESKGPRHGANFRVFDPLEFIRLRPSGFG